MQGEQYEPADERPQRRDMVLSPKASDADPGGGAGTVAGRGGFDVVVPPGVRVESSDYWVLCGTWNSIPEQELPADTPVVRLRTIGVLSWAAAKPKFLYEMPD